MFPGWLERSILSVPPRCTTSFPSRTSARSRPSWDQIPLRVDRERFTRLCSGFPLIAISSSPRPVETVAHFALVAPSPPRRLLAPGRDGGRLEAGGGRRRPQPPLLPDRGSLSFFGADIVSAEAFSNSEALVLDTFSVSDAQRRFEQPEEGRRFQAFLEKAWPARSTSSASWRPEAGA